MRLFSLFGDRSYFSEYSQTVYLPELPVQATTMGPQTNVSDGKSDIEDRKHPGEVLVTPKSIDAAEPADADESNGGA